MRLPSSPEVTLRDAPPFADAPNLIKIRGTGSPGIGYAKGR